MKTLASLFLLVICFIASAQDKSVFTDKDGAIRGYDPVAYFEQGEPVKGQESLTYEWNGASWYFSSQKNLDAFKADPEKYTPQFGGYCAYAVGNGYTYESDPNAWKIVDGKLYLNYSKGVQKKWMEKQDFYIQEANTNWPKLIKKD